MLKIENVEIAGWEAAIRGMRNPKNSWDRSDSYPAVDCGACGRIERDGECKKEDRDCSGFECYQIGTNDMGLMMNLAKGGPVHAKYRRMIVVWMDITAPLYWWKEFDTYKVGTVANSCSTMHKIHDKEFTLEDFSCEHLGVLIPSELNDGCEIFQNLPIEHFKETIKVLNVQRRFYNRETNPELKKKYWWQMIQLLPSSYNQKRTICLNYEVLHHIYHDRRNHKLDEWHTFCDWIESLPYSEIITQKVVGIE